MWRPGNASRNRLPEERRALAERYTIDAEEARRREQLAAEAAARAEAERVAAEQAAREEAARTEAEVEPPAAPAGAGEPDSACAGLPAADADAPAPSVSPDLEETADAERAASERALPIYRWFGDR